jgi:hypothetical protein
MLLLWGILFFFTPAPSKLTSWGSNKLPVLRSLRRRPHGVSLIRPGGKAYVPTRFDTSLLALAEDDCRARTQTG